MKPTLIVLAAGMGSRYGGLKQMDAFGPNGETIIEYSVFDAIRAGFGKVVFVIRETFADAFKEQLGTKFADKIEVEYVYQELNKLPEGFSVPEGREKPWGTGHALMMAADATTTPFAVINADDFYGVESYQVMAEFLNKQANDSNNFSLLGYEVRNTLSENGSVSRGVCEVSETGDMLGVTERTKIYREDGVIVFEEGNVKTPLSEVAPVSMNFMGFTPLAFDFFKKAFVNFLETQGQEMKSEFFMPFVLDEMAKTGMAKVNVINTPAKWFGVTYQEDKPLALDYLNKLIAQGEYPSNLWA